MSSDEGKGAALLLAGAGGGLFAYYGGIKTFGLLKKIENTPTSKIIAAYPGTVEMQGRAKRFENLLESPLEKKPCVFFRVITKKWSGSGKSRRCEEVGRKASKEWFYIEDDTGKIRVDPEGLSRDTQGIAKDKNASIDRMPSKDGGGLFNAIRQAFGGSEAQKTVDAPALNDAERGSQVASFVAQHYPQLRGYGDRIEVEETYVQEGDPLYLIGTAQNDDWHGGGHLVMKKVGGRPFYICDGTEKEARGHLGTATYLSMLGGPALFAICAFILAVAYLKADSALAANLLGAACLLMYAYAGLVALLEMYNGIVLLRAQIEMARGNLQALYKRRHDLIPRLETVVKEAARYERELQGEIARIRAEGESSQGKSFMALAENYPKLRANESFIAFQRELSDTETWLAGGRSFLVETIALYNTRVQTFPYSFFAKIGGFAPASMEIG